MGVNYGLNKVRFIAPVHVGASVRTRVTLKEVTDVPGGIQVIIEGTFEVKEKVPPAPACLVCVVCRTNVADACRVVCVCACVVSCVQGKSEPSKKPVAIVEQIARYYV